MRKVLIILAVIGIYLNQTYAYFYNFLGRMNLTSPPHQTQEFIGNNQQINTIIYVALGDSLTAGVGASDYQHSYPHLLAQKMSQYNNVELLNFAQAGAVSDDVLSQQLPQVLSVKPDLITLLIGVNDIHNLKSVTKFESNYNQIVSALKKTNARIFLLSIPYLGSDKIVFFPYNFILDFRTKQFNATIQKVAADYQVHYVNLLPSQNQAEFYSSDQFHPGDSGYKEWAQIINVN